MAEAGARVPLFDRLADHERLDADEHKVLLHLDRAGLRQSVRREIERLVNTRSAGRVEELAAEGRHNLNYGIPDLSLFSPLDHESAQAVAACIREAIERFEPRLRLADVSVVEALRERSSMTVRVDGWLSHGAEREPLSIEFVPFGKEA